MPEWVKQQKRSNYPKGEPVVCFEKMHVYVYKVSYNKGDTGEMKDSKKCWGDKIIRRQLPYSE